MEMHSIRGLVRDLQDEVDTEAGLLSDVKLALSEYEDPLELASFLLLGLKASKRCSAQLPGALSNIVADNTARTKTAARLNSRDPSQRIVSCNEITDRGRKPPYGMDMLRLGLPMNNKGMCGHAHGDW